MNPVKPSKEKLINEITGYLTALEVLVRQRNSMKLYDINRHCESFYCDLLNVVLKRDGHRLRLVPADNAEHPNQSGIDLIDKERKVMVQVTSSFSIEKVKHTFKEINDPQYANFILYFIFIAGKSGKIDFRKVRPPKSVKCTREHLLSPEDLTAMLQGKGIRTMQKVLEVLQCHLGSEDHAHSEDNLFYFINQIAGLVKSVNNVRCMCEEFLQILQATKEVTGLAPVLIQRINHQVSNHIPNNLPDLGPIRQKWARDTQIYSMLLGIGHLVFEIDCTGRDDPRSLDVHEVKKLVEALLTKIRSTIIYMCKAAAVSEEVAFTELTIIANEC